MPPKPRPDAHETTSDGARADKIDPQVMKVAWALLVGGLAVLFDTTIVSVGLKTIATDLHVSTSTVQWVSTAYLLALGITVPLVGWAQRVVGSRRLWMVALAVFLGGSILSSLSWDGGSLIAFRAVQGVGGGLMMPLMLTIIVQAAGGKNLARIAAIIGLPTAVGPVFGPVIGGLILQYLHWSWLFWVNVPFCVAGLVLAWRVLPADGPVVRLPLDVVGLLLMATGFVGILYGLSRTEDAGGFVHAQVLVPAITGAVLVSAFVVWARHRGDRALVDIRLLRHRPLASGSAVMFLSGFGLYGAMLLLPLFFQELRGADVLAAGLLLAPQGVGTLASRLSTNWLLARFGARATVMGAFAVATVATVPFALASSGTSTGWLMVVLFVRGFGLGTVMIPTMAVAYEGLETSAVPDASIVTRVFQQIGGSFGTAVLATVLASHPGSTTVAFHSAFWWAVGFTALAMVVSLLLPGRASATDAP
ncbi:MAG: multidrug efflux MFS transporter [Cellulomonas sp.]|jgi:EmrB/QacA subfamily drug resistance transporter|nr:multidrug efflux MFS transporter [Cellulomonas sp.]